MSNMVSIIQLSGSQWSATQIWYQTTETTVPVSMDAVNANVKVKLPATTGGIAIFGEGTNNANLNVNVPATLFAGSLTVSLHQPSVTPPTLVWRKEGDPTAAPSSSGIVASSGQPVTRTFGEGSQSTSIIPSQTNNPQSDPSPGISPGAIAGIAIGCLLSGALIAGIILFFCWRKRKASPVRDHEASKIALMPQEKGFSVNTASVGSSSLAGSPVAGLTPLPLEDKAITGEISKISNLIKNHVQSYYHTGHVSQGLIDFDDVQALGSAIPVPVGTLSTLWSNSATREIALRFCIAWVACSRMLLRTGSSVSLLPPEVAGCSQSISQIPKTTPSNAALQARWRSSTAELLHNTYVQNAFTASDSRNESIQETIRALDNVLQPYADPRMDNEQRKRNLEEILKRCASFAFTLFSQPSTWDFDWKVEQAGKSGELCVFPALIQVTDDHGKAVQPPRPFSEAIVRKLEG